MSPRCERIGDAELWLGRCEDILPTLSGIDAICSDPPYGIAYRHSGVGGPVTNRAAGKSFTRRGMVAIAGDRAPFDPAHLSGWPTLLFGANHFYAHLPDGGTMHVWDKTRGGLGPDDNFSDVEFFWTSWRCRSVAIRHLWKGVCQDSEKGQQRYHQNQKPVQVMAECLALLPDAEIVCDPYMGSASTALACIALGRRFIGIEIEPAHYETALRRIEAAYRQPRLFAEPAPKPQQVGMAL